METFKPLDIDQSLPTKDKLRILRTNALGSLFYHTKFVLRRTRLYEPLHLPLCNHLEKDHLKDVIEWPRDHFKSTCATEALPTWTSLPFLAEDEDHFKQIGYSDEFIRWMRRKHNPLLRNCLVSENITNAAKLGRRVRWHFEANTIFKTLFPEIQPNSSCKWTDYSLEIKRPGTGGSHGEGTFDFVGVGGAVQSRHYNGLLLQDDLVGKKARESNSVMEKTIDFHTSLPGCFEDEDPNHEAPELVIGNRWAYHDMNTYIREHETWFNITTHSALGGCCSAHPPNVPILPTIFSFDKLMQLKARLKSYAFSCQYLNNPASPEDADFKEEWLSYFKYAVAPDGSQTIEHYSKGTGIKKDIHPEQLAKTMIVDPNHAGNAGRCRHAIVVVGADYNQEYYLLETWAKACGYDEFYNQVFALAQRHQIRKIGVETVAAQRYVAHHIEHLNRTKPWRVKIIELKGEVEGPDGELTRKKEWRIRNIVSPIAEEGRLWVQKESADFIAEFTTFPKGRFWDQLDAFAYAPQIMRKGYLVNPYQAAAMKMANQQQAKKVNTPYSYGVN